MKYRLSEIEVEETLSEVITGKRVFTFNDRVFTIQHPSPDDKDRARTIYISRYKELEKVGIMKKEDLKIFYLKAGVIPTNFYSEKKKLEEKIEELYRVREKTGSKIQVAQLDSEVYTLSERLYEIERKEDILMVNSLEYNAESARINYIISKVVYTGSEFSTRYWNNYDEFLQDNSSKFILLCKNEYRLLNEGIPIKKIRALARSDEWSRRWEISKKLGTPVFDGVSADWDKNKINLCYWSNWYDNIIKVLELKNSEILDDDEALFETIRQINNGQKEVSQAKSGVVQSVKTPYKIRY